MNRELIKEWIFALRSGRYTPMKRSREFYDKNNDACGCGVGVLGKVLGLKETEVLNVLCGYSVTKDTFWGKRQHPQLPYFEMKAQTIRKKLGVSKKVLEYVSEAYEAGASFEEIADYLETVVLGETSAVQEQPQVVEGSEQP